MSGQVYNVRKKIFADGTEQYSIAPNLRCVGYELTPADRLPKVGSVDKDRSRSVAAKRAIQMVYDLAKSNLWDWFITLTFDPVKVNSFDYDACVEAIKLFTQALRDRGDIGYLLVPELHKSGAYHFHGLVIGDLPHEPARRSSGRLIFDGKGHQVYNIPIYKYGHTMAVRCYTQSRTGYVAKYITKQDAVPEGRKRYWASRNLQRPTVEYSVMQYMSEYVELLSRADYHKVIQSPYGDYEVLEIHGEEEQGLRTRVNKIKILFTQEEEKTAC